MTSLEVGSRSIEAPGAVERPWGELKLRLPVTINSTGQTLPSTITVCKGRGEAFEKEPTTNSSCLGGPAKLRALDSAFACWASFARCARCARCACNFCNTACHTSACGCGDEPWKVLVIPTLGSICTDYSLVVMVAGRGFVLYRSGPSLFAMGLNIANRVCSWTQYTCHWIPKPGFVSGRGCGDVGFQKGFRLESSSVSTATLTLYPLTATPPFVPIQGLRKT